MWGKKTKTWRRENKKPDSIKKQEASQCACSRGDKQYELEKKPGARRGHGKELKFHAKYLGNLLEKLSRAVIGSEMSF